MRSFPQPVATHGNGFGLFGRSSAGAICDRLPPVATTGLHKGSIHCCLVLATAAIASAASRSGRRRPYRCGNEWRPMFSGGLRATAIASMLAAPMMI
jgi:hypothetical protein